MNTVENSLAILKELEGPLKQIDPDQAEALIDAILCADQVFVAGTGRSQMMVRGLAMRLMHLGFKAFVVGETVTPAIEPGDLLIIGSGSGETSTLAIIANKTKSGRQAGSYYYLPGFDDRQIGGYCRSHPCGYYQAQGG